MKKLFISGIVIGLGFVLVLIVGSMQQRGLKTKNEQSQLVLAEKLKVDKSLVLNYQQKQRFGSVRLYEDESRRLGIDEQSEALMDVVVVKALLKDETLKAIKIGKYDVSTVQDIASSLLNIEKELSKPMEEDEQRLWRADYNTLQNAYFLGVKQIRGIQKPSETAQKRLDHYQKEAQHIDNSEQLKALKAKILIEQVNP